MEIQGVALVQYGRFSLIVEHSFSMWRTRFTRIRHACANFMMLNRKFCITYSIYQ